MAEKLVYKQHSFMGGLNARDASHLIKEDELAIGSKNFVLDELGKILKRNGYSKFNAVASTNDFTSLFRMYRTNGTKKWIAIEGTNVQHYSDLGVKDASPIFSTLTNNKKAEFAYNIWDDSVYFVNGADGLLKDNGSSVSSVTTGLSLTNDPKYITTAAARIFLAGDSTYRNRVFFSGSELVAWDTSVWDVGSIIDIDTTKGAYITQIKAMMNNIIVYTHNNIAVIRLGDTPDSYRSEYVNASIGCIAPRTLVEVDNSHVFLSKDGIATFNGSTVEIMSDLVKPILDKANPAQIENACATVWDRKIIFTIPGEDSSVNNISIVFDMVSGAFCYWENTPAIQYETTGMKGDSDDLYFISGKHIYKFDTGYEDDGEAIEMVAITKNNDFERPESIKKYKHQRIHAFTGNGDLEVQFKVNDENFALAVPIDLGGESFSWGDSHKWGDSDVKWSGNGILYYRLYETAKGRYIQYKFTHSGPYPVQLLGITQFFRYKRAK